jgi:hypothetical protein
MQELWARVEGLPVGAAAVELSYSLLGDPSNPMIDAEELQRLCDAAPEMSDEDNATYREGVRAMLVNLWTSWGETPEAIEAMLAAEENPSGDL